MRGQWICVMFAARLAAGAEIRLDQGLFRVTGWDGANASQPAAWEQVFQVFSGAEPAADQPRMLGDYRIEGGALVFEPRFPLQPGLRYRAVFHPTKAVAILDGPARVAREPSEVRNVFPTTARLPENQLKLYIHFSGPMSRGEAYRNIRLLDESDKAAGLPFLEIEQELWDPTGTRLTLLFDPGRIKTGLVPNQEEGLALVSGKRYTFVVSRDWKDAQGTPLKEDFRKTFRAGAADHEPINPKRWRLTVPKGETLDPLIVDFREPLDRALAERLVTVVDRGGQRLEGDIRLEKEETVWRFTPREPWKPAEYRLRIGTWLEDLAGNRVGRPFEVDAFDKVTTRIKTETSDLPFRVRTK
ncbi:MAG: Ig-like domain-containing protein [Bryobacteraceae bacterium]